MRQKLKAGALQLTIFIVVIIALLLSAFLIFIHTHKQFETQTDLVLETIENANRGVHYALENDIRLNDTVALELQEEAYKNLTVHRELWGVFEKVVTTSTIKHKIFQKAALVGALQPEQERIALYLENNNKPLIVVGRTKIQGTAFLPEQGVRPGNISGEGYYGTRLVYGLKKMSADLPEIAPEVLDKIKSIQQKPLITDRRQVLQLGKRRIYHNSFFEPVEVIYQASELTLANIALSGHIFVQSDTKITVMANTKLSGVILAAPQIEIKNNVKGYFQAFATEKIIMGENCKLHYPSALVLNEKKINQQQDSLGNKKNSLKIKENTIIEGIVAYLGEYDPSNYQPQVIIEENSLIRGEVYCMENLELNGTIFGSVFTANFIVPRFGTIYQNHLYNSRIITKNLPQKYVGLLFENSEKGIAKWLQ